jgi:hypothetical protein
MIVSDGLRTCEFCWSHERQKKGKVLEFRTIEDASSWLTSLRIQRRSFVSEISNLLAYHAEMDTFRLSDQQVIEEAALLLQSRRLVVICQKEEQQYTYAPPAKEPIKLTPFPLPQHTAPRPAPIAAPAEVPPPTFSPNVNFAAQAAALMAAANSGAPFCPQ